MTAEISEARSWQNAEIDCDRCVHRQLLVDARCQLKHACVQDRYARRIDRFFSWNSALANEHLTHPYFEVRAVAAKYASDSYLPQLINDPDETVRAHAALSLPRELLVQLRKDPHREVRVRVASRLEGADLYAMIGE